MGRIALSVKRALAALSSTIKITRTKREISYNTFKKENFTPSRYTRRGVTPQGDATVLG